MEDNYIAQIFFLMIRVWTRITLWLVAAGLSIGRAITQRRVEHAGNYTEPLSEKIRRLWYSLTHEYAGNVGVVVLVSAGIAFVVWLVLFFSTQQTSSTTFVFPLIIFVALCLGVGFILNAPQHEHRELRVIENASEVIPQVAMPQLPIVLVYTIRVAATAEWEPERALQCMQQLLRTFGKLVFQIQATAQNVLWQVVDIQLGIDPTLIGAAIRASYPDAEIEVNEVGFGVPAPFHRLTLHYKQANDFIMPLKYVEDFRRVDPLAGIAQVMTNLLPGEQVTYILAVEDLATYAYKQGHQMITQSTIKPWHFLFGQGVNAAIVKSMTGNTRTDKYVKELQRVMEGKLQHELFEARLFIEIETSTQERFVHLALMDGHFINFTRQPFNALAGAFSLKQVKEQIITVETIEDNFRTMSGGLYHYWLREGRQDERRHRQRRSTTKLILEPRELAALWHLPHRHYTTPTIAWLPSHQVSLPAVLLGENEGVCLGYGKYAGKEFPVYIKQDDRESHMNIVGRSGVGKSSLMHSLIHQDITAGKGVTVIDPHGTLVKNILRYSIPPERMNDVIILDLANRAYPPPLNPLRGDLGNVRIGQVLNLIERLFPDTVQYARLLRYMRAALQTLRADSEATMRDMVRIFLDDSYRYRLLRTTTNDEALVTWGEYEQAKGEQRQIRDPILSRISPFYGNDDLYPMLCHPDTFDFRKHIRDGKIILISLAMDAEEVSDDELDLIGALLISRLQVSGMKENDAPTHYVYIDEVQRFVTSSLDQMFWGARKFHLSLTVAHQHLGQIPQKTREAILGNVGATIVFQCSPTDARAFSPYINPPFHAKDLVNLDKYQAVVKMQELGITQPAFTLFTEYPLHKNQPPDEAALAREAHLRQRSQQVYTPKSRTEVLTWLKERYQRPTQPLEKNTDDMETLSEKKSPTAPSDGSTGQELTALS